MKGFVPNEDDVNSYLSIADLDKDGKITLQEFEKLILKTLKKPWVKMMFEFEKIHLLNLLKQTNLFDF